MIKDWIRSYKVFMVSKAIGKKNSNKIYKNIYKYKYNKN